MVVMSLIAIIVFLTGSSLSFLERMMVRAELEQLYITCYLLQRSAMMLHQSHILTFDVAQHSYHYKNVHYSLPIQVRFGTAPHVKGPPSTADGEIEIPVTFKEYNITFTPEGIIQPGAIYLTDRSQVCTYALSSAVGHVSYLRKYQYTHAWCLL